METTEHVVQYVKGSILIGNAGLSSRQKREGYVAMLCTVNDIGRFVDLAVTKEQICELIKSLQAELKLEGFECE